MKTITYDMCLQYINERNIFAVHEDSEEYYYDEKINNADDKIFRDLLSDKEEAVKFINKFLEIKRQLKKDDLESYNSSYITKEYKNRESDIVYKIKNTNTFILIEHQSYVDELMPYRMLEYSVEIMRSALNRKRKKNCKYKCPEVVLVVLYTGSEKWKIEREYKKISDDEINYYTNGTNSIYNLIDIHNYAKEDLVKGESIIEKAMAIEKCKTEEELKETLEKLISTTKEEKDKEKIGRIIQYILSPIIGKEQAEILLNKLKKEDNNMAGMLITNLMEERRKLIAESEKRGQERGIKLGQKLGEKRGEKRGEKLGEKRGEQNSKTKIIKQMLNHNESINKIKLYTNATEEEIEEIRLQVANE